jgi:hypothetical protein
MANQKIRCDASEIHSKMKIELYLSLKFSYGI